MHGEKDILGNKNTMQTDIAALKKISRTVFSLTCPLEHEWIIKPSYARGNRLRSIAVANKHASIKGMPVVTDEENSQIVKRLLAMRGIRSIKQQKAWGDDNLHVKPAVVSFKGGTDWLYKDSKDEKMANWVMKGCDGGTAWNNMQAIKLRHMGCPGCGKND